MSVIDDERDPIPEPEIVDGLPVLAGEGAAAPAAQPPGGGLTVTPGRQVAALAATGFMAGAATVALAHRRRARTVRKQLARRKAGRSAFGEIVTSNSFLVDVHLLRRGD